MDIELKSADDPTPVWRMPYEGQLILVTKIGDSVTVPDGGVVGRVVDVDLDGGCFEFLPNEPDLTRNGAGMTTREFVQWWNNKRMGTTRRGWRVSGMMAEWKDAFYVIDEETDGCL